MRYEARFCIVRGPGDGETMTYEVAIPYDADTDEGAAIAGALITHRHLGDLTARASDPNEPWPFPNGLP